MRASFAPRSRIRNRKHNGAGSFHGDMTLDFVNRMNEQFYVAEDPLTVTFSIFTPPHIHILNACRADRRKRPQQSTCLKRWQGKRRKYISSKRKIKNAERSKKGCPLARSIALELLSKANEHFCVVKFGNGRRPLQVRRTQHLETVSQTIWYKLYRWWKKCTKTLFEWFKLVSRCLKTADETQKACYGLLIWKLLWQGSADAQHGQQWRKRR